MHKIEVGKLSASHWQLVADSKATGSGAGGAKDAPRKKFLAKKLHVDNAKPFLPGVPYCRMWHEPQTDRIRGSYKTKNAGLRTRSSAVAGDMDAACRWVLAWTWKVHTECRGGQCPYPPLRKWPPH